MMARKRGAAIYVRVSTDKQTVENQVRELRQIAERRGWEVVEQYSDAGISGSKGRDDRPGLDQMLKDAQRRRFDVVMAWAIDRLGRSLIDLLGTIQALEACGVDLYLDQQASIPRRPLVKPDVSGYRRVRGVRAWHDPSAYPRRPQAGCRGGQDARTAADQPCH